MNAIPDDKTIVTHALRFLALGATGIVFPRLLLAASVSFPVPYQLVAVHMNTSFFLFSPNVVIGFSLVIGTPLPFITLSDGVRSICSHYQGSDFTAGFSENYPTVWGKFDDFDVIIQPGESLCLYGVIGPLAEPPAIIVSATCHLKPLA